MTAAVLITGMLVALYVIRTGVKPVGAIVMAQAVTVIAAPLMAGVLLWLCNQRSTWASTGTDLCSMSWAAWAS